MTAVEALLAWYGRFGRKHLPWRGTRDPYKIVVAEFMLQQTQVDRVQPLYEAFIARFPTFATLAAAETGDVLRAWRGLGYNSRALRLRALAKSVQEKYAGVLPRERLQLLALPGIGSYTAAAVRAFAFGHDDVALDTNVRRVVQRVYFGIEYPTRAADREIDAVAAEMVPAGHGHDYNSAIMDLGASVCTSRAPKCLLCPLQTYCAAAPIDPARLAQYARSVARRGPQETLPFVQTTRFLRGRIVDRLRDLPQHGMLTIEELQAELRTRVPAERSTDIPDVVARLVDEGILESVGLGLRLSRS